MEYADATLIVLAERLGVARAHAAGLERHVEDGLRGVADSL